MLKIIGTLFLEAAGNYFSSFQFERIHRRTEISSVWELGLWKYLFCDLAFQTAWL